MTTYSELPKKELLDLKAALDKEYAEHKAKGLSLNMARGKPAAAQLDLSMPMLDLVNAESACVSENGTDLRNYGILDGIPECKRLMASMLDDDPENVIVFGNSSLTIMYDSIMRFMVFGTQGYTPWSKLDTVKFLCPVPGYDRHFAITERFGIEMVNVPLLEDGPDMDVVEELVKDAAVKGIWCVPKYANPSGITYSDEVVRRLASMECAAEDFKIMWDNAYCVHHLNADTAEQDQLLDIGKACVEAGNPNRYYKFASTSKVTFPGAGVAAMAASPANIDEVRSHITIQMIGHDKLNQLRHALFLRDGEGIAEHMQKHAALIAPKFELVVKMLEEGLGDTGCASWTNPRGGYFISFDGLEGTAKRIVGLAKEAGVTMTGAGATYPYKRDPKDSNIRIAPTLPPLAELEQAMEVFICCVKLASVEKLLEV
ncbi:MAG: aminotransferase [Coriobacteriia bacterium]|nr:aminotransferase [Coriobacteriia bacterium]